LQEITGQAKAGKRGDYNRRADNCQTI
jgi:hypothetical protein